jgi:hypothetical protein
LDMEATNTGNSLHLFRIIAQDGTTPNWAFQFCNSAPCTPASNGLSIAGLTGIITFAAGQTFPGAGSGTVTSFSSGNLAPLFSTSVATATTSPALSFSLTSQAANLVFAGPNGAAGAPTFRSIVGADLPATISSNTSGTAANVTGTVAIANGGTGQTTAASARTALGAAASVANADISSMSALTSVTSAVTMNNVGNSFTGNGAALTNLTAANINAGIAGINITGNAATATSISGTVAIANGGTGQTTAAAARTALGAAALGANADITSMTAVASLTNATTGVSITAASTTAPTNVALNAGSPTSGSTDGGDIVLTPGTPHGSGNSGVVQVIGAIGTGGSANTDLAGQLTLNGVGTASFSFTGKYSTAPICVAADTTAVAAVRVTATTSTLTVNGTAAHVLNYICVARQ